MENKPQKTELIMFLVGLFIVGMGMYFLGPSITGFVIKELSYSEDLNLVVASSGNYTWQLQNIGDLKSVKLDGKVTTYGKARVYIESEGIKHLIFDSTRLNQSTQIYNQSNNFITGFAVKEDKNKTQSDEDRKKNNHKPEWKSDTTEFSINGTKTVNLSEYFSDNDGDALIYSASEPDGVAVSINNEIVEMASYPDDDFNTTITFIASDGIDSNSQIVGLIVYSISKIQTIDNQSINITPILNETQISNNSNETINTTIPINETQIINGTNATINQTKIIWVNLSYNSGTIYDANDNGEESVNGIVDLTAANTKFSWNVDKSRLCTRWEVYSADDAKITTFCNGNNACCAFANLQPTKGNWSDIYHSSFGKDGASHSNAVSAQVIYYDVNLSIENATSEIYISSWENKSVKFFEEETAFSNICADTCTVNGLNKSSYNLIFEIEDSAVLKIDRIKYSIMADVQNSAPLLLQNFSTINVSRNKNITINLSQYFADPDGDILNYNYYRTDNITVLFGNDIATIMPDKRFEGTRYMYFTANDTDLATVSNVFMINVSQEKYKPKVEIGKKVRWKSAILIDADNVSSVNMTLPDTASNITIGILNETVQRKLPDDKIKFIENGKVKDKNIFEAEKDLEEVKKKISILEEAKRKKSLKVVDEQQLNAIDFDSKLNELYNKKSELQQQLQVQNPNLITGNIVALSETAINETLPILLINESLPKNAEVQIEYETEAPIAIENEIDAYTKQVKVVSQTSYEDVLSYTSLNDVPQNVIKLYWMQNGEKTLFTNVKYYDDNNNSLIDRIEWVIPHLSNQTFEVSISVLNVQSYPTVGGNWTVAFNTTGTGNLTIFAFDGTSYAEKEADDLNTTNDLDILELKCDNNILEPYYIVDFGNLSLEGLNTISGNAVKKIENSIMNLESNEKEKSGSHSLANAPDQTLVSTKTDYIKPNVFKYLSVEKTTLTELGSHSLVIALDSGSSVLRRHAGSNSLSNEMNLPPPASNKINSLNEYPITTTNKDNNQNPIANFFTIIPSAYALHIGSGSYNTINFNGNNYALLTKEQLTGHSYKIIGVYYQDYNCDNSTGYWTVHVLTPGIHNQRFNFSNQIADAHNLASAAGGTTNGSIFRFVDDTDTDFLKGNLTSSNLITSMVVGTGGGANLTINISSLQNQTQNMQSDRFIVPNASTILLLHFEEGQGQYANDSSIYQQDNGTLGANNAAASDDPAWNSSAKFGSFALTFNGVNAFVNLSNLSSSVKGLSSASVEAWIKPVNIVAQVQILDIYYESVSTSSNRRFSLIQNGTSVQLRWRNTDAGAINVLNTPQELMNNTWHYVVATIDSSEAKIFVDGVQMASKASGLTVFDSTSPQYTLVGGFTVSTSFNGTIDELAVWNVSIDNATIQNHYQKGWGYFNTSNFTSQVFDANRSVNWSYMSWSTEANDKGVSNLYQSDLSDLVNASTVLYMKFNNDTLESERQLNATYNISNEQNLVLYMPFDSANAFELTPNGSTVLLMHFNNVSPENYNLSNGTFILDNSSYGNNGTMYGNTSGIGLNYSQNGGKFGGAFVFDGIDDFVNVSTYREATPSMTVEAWFNPKDTLHQNNILVQIDSSKSIARELLYTTGGVVTTNLGATGLSSAISPPLNSWTHAAVTFDGTNLKLYVNGILSASTTTSLGCNNCQILIGAGKTLAGNQFFNGSIDEVAIWNVSLTPEIIAKHSGYGIDKSIYGNNATLMNGSIVNQSGKFQEAMQFNGTDSYIDVANETYFDFSKTSKFSACAWINLRTTSPAGQAIISKKITGGQDSGWEFNANDFGDADSDGLQFILSSTTSADAIQVYNSNKLVPNTWYHTCSTYNGSSSASGVKIFINGVSTAFTVTEDDLLSSTLNNNPVRIGMRSNSSLAPFNGTIDEVAIWNISLPADKIAEIAGAKVQDYSNYGNNGTRFSNTSSDFGANYTYGKFGKGLLFDGVNDYVNVSTYNAVTPSMTVEAWFNPRDYSNSNTILAQVNTISTGRNLLFLGVGTGYIATNIGQSGLSSAISPPLNSWTHAAVTFDGTNLKLYVNGILSASTTTSLECNNCQILIGAGKTLAGNQFFNGTIDEVAIWNISLTADDIKRQYERGALKLNLSYRTSNDNSTWTAWTPAVNNNTLSPITGFSIADDSLVDVVTDVKVKNSALKKLYGDNKVKESDYSGLSPLGFSSNLRSSPVLYTLTLDCLFNLGSFDQISESSFKAKAKNGASLAWGDICSDSALNSSKDSIGFTSTNSSNVEMANSISLSLLIPEYFIRSGLLSLNSENAYFGTNNSSPNKSEFTINALTGFSRNTRKSKIFCVPEIYDFCENENNIFVLTTNFTYHPSAWNLFHIPSFTFSPSSNASFSVNLLCPKTLSSANNNSCLFLLSSNSCLTAFSKTEDHSMSECLSISSFTSGGTFNFNSAILSPQETNENGYLKVAENKEFKLKKVKIKDIKEGDYVLSLDENSGKLRPAKVNALLDHGIRPIRELKTISEKSINTTAEHPYLVKLYDKNLCDKYADTFWNINASKTEDFDGDYCTRWVEVSDLKEGMEIAVPKLQNKFFDLRNSTNSSVVNTLTNDCFLKCGSLDQIGRLPIDKDKAKHSVSSGSEMSLLASSRNSSNMDFLTIFMCTSNFEINESTSLGDKEESNLILERCSFNSSNKYSGANNFRFLENNKDFVAPLPVNPVNKMPKSTISSSSSESIYLNMGYSFLYLSCNPFLASLAKRIASSSVNLDLETILLNSQKSSCSISRFMASSLATSDQFIHWNLSIFAFNSSGTVNDTFAIYASPLCLLNNSNSSNSLTFFSNAVLNTSGQFMSLCLSSLSFNSFGKDIVIVGILGNLPVLIYPHDYVRILENVQIYKPSDSDIEFEKITSIEALDEQHVYDLSIEGTHNFIANDIVAHNTGNAIARFFQYKADFNTTDARFAPILNNVSINYSLRSNLTIFYVNVTNAIPGYLITFVANFSDLVNPINGTSINCSISDNYTSSWSPEINMSFNSVTKVYEYNKTFSKYRTAYYNITCNAAVLGYNILQTVDNFVAMPALNCSAGCFNVGFGTASNVSAFDSYGNLFLSGNITTLVNTPISTFNSFIVQNNSGGTVAYINRTGSMFIKGDLNQNFDAAGCSPPPNSFVIQNKSGDCVAYINSTGDLWLRGVLINGSVLT